MPAVWKAVAALMLEMDRVRAGQAEGLWVLDDEIAHTAAVADNCPPGPGN